MTYSQSGRIVRLTFMIKRPTLRCRKRRCDALAELDTLIRSDGHHATDHPYRWVAATGYTNEQDFTLSGADLPGWAGTN